jgi:hypothetical protein
MGRIDLFCGTIDPVKRWIGILTALPLVGACSLESLFEDKCASSAECAAEGRCGTSFYRAGDGVTRCYVRGPDDCRRSRACAAEGRCAFDPRASLDCVRPGAAPAAAGPGPCARDVVCRDFGMCGVFEGTCAATDAATCARSLGCVLHGRCSFVAASRMCGAASDADCAGSLECLAFGRCTRPTHPLLGTAIACAGPDRVMPAYGDLQCTRIPECRSAGRCLRADDGACRTPEEAGVPGERLRAALRRFDP